MLHYFIGDLGHLFVITSFVAALITSFYYWKATVAVDLSKRYQWTFNGRTTFLIHFAGLIGIIATLFTIIFNHYFEYHYAYAHSSMHLPKHYMISCFWQGQEGSFLLWTFWQAVVGLVLIFTQRSWEAPVMTIFSMVQAFLTSMIIGVVIPGLSIKIGSSPFILLRDAMADPIFKIQPDFIPKDGNGLNPLLQNYWMVIHPPTLFLGFALTLVPFAFCMAGLWQRRYIDWIRPALPWTLLGSAILGLGILMGGYWAYETLSFGGYWNWDPVENAVYVPWLILIASLHTMITYKNSKTALKLSMILVITVFILILYSTFLTRSGILGDASVHSFTDLGLSGQLLIYLLFFTFAAIILVWIRWKEIPTSDKEISTYSREFWIFLGASTLCLMGFQVIVETSKPVYNSIIRLFGGEGKMAPRADAVHFYSMVQLWFAVMVAMLSGTGQFFWWKKIDKQKLKSELIITGLITLVIFVIVMLITDVSDPIYLALLIAGLYIIISNIKVLISVFKVNPKLSGGAIAHISIGLMLIGMMFSSGYSKVVSLNNTGLLLNKEMGTEFNRDNLLLFINETRSMSGYDIEFLGERLEPRNKPGYVKKKDVEITTDPYKVVAINDIFFKGNKLYNAKDTFEVNPENTFYEIQLRKGDKVSATLFPRIQVNPSMGGILPSPDIRRGVTSDLYTHVSSSMNRESEPEWGNTEEVKIKIGQQFFVNDYVSVLEEVQRVTEVPGLKLNDEDIAVKAKIRIEGEHEIYYAEPIFLIRNKTLPGVLAYEVGELGVKITLLNIHPDTDEFTLGLSGRQKDWVIIKAMEKPYINVLWLGTGLLMIGFIVAMVRRFKEKA